MVPEVASDLDRVSKLRGDVWKCLEDVSAEGLNWTPLAEGTNSLLVLATHSIGSEHGWIGETLAQGPRTRVRTSEFQARGNDLTGLREQFEATARETERILAGLGEADLEQTRASGTYGQVTVRWILLHVIEHYAEHLGQLRLTRQLWENRA